MAVLNTADKIALGSHQASAVYLGTNKVWEGTVVPPATHLLGAYAFDTDGTDASGNGRTMTDLNGSVTTFADGVASVLTTSGGYAVQRLGVVSQSVSMGPSFTFMAWIKWHTTDQGDGMMVIGPGDSSTGPENGGYRAYLTSGGSLITFDDRVDSVSFDATGILNLNVQDTFVHIAFSFDETTGTFSGYVNGDLAGSHTGLTGLAAGMWSWGLHGHSSSNSDPAIYDDVRLYDVALTVKDIQECMLIDVGSNPDPVYSPPAEPRLLAAYSFDDQDGTDASGNGNTGTIVPNGNASAFDTGRTGYGLGIASQVSAPYMTIPKMRMTPRGAWTMMAWISPLAAGGAAVIADAALIGGSTMQFLVNSGIGLCGAYMNTDAGSAGAWFGGDTVDFTTGWHHVAFVYNGFGILAAVIDGEAVSSHDFGGQGTVYNGTNPWFINHDNENNYNGSSVIDDWRFYDGLLTAEQIITCMNTPVGTTADPLATPPTTSTTTLLTAYSFDEGAGTVAADASGNGHDMPVNTGNQPTWATGHTGSGIGHASGTASGIANSDASTWIPNNGPLTIMMWANPTNTGYDQCLWDLGGTTGNRGNFDLFYINPSIQLLTPAGVQATVDWAPDGEWHHWCGVYDGWGTALYMDGVLVGVGFGTHTIMQDTADFTIAMSQNFNMPLAGVVDDFRMYEGALTPEQIVTCMGVPVDTAADPLGPF